LPLVPEFAEPAWHLFVVRHPQRDVIMAQLAERQIFLNISYPWPIHIMTGYRHLGYKEGDFPVADAHVKEILCLPMFPELTEEEVHRVADALWAFFAEKGQVAIAQAPRSPDAVSGAMALPA